MVRTLINQPTVRVLNYCFPEQSQNPNQLIHIFYSDAVLRIEYGLIDLDFYFAQESNNVKHWDGRSWRPFQ